MHPDYILVSDELGGNSRKRGSVYKHVSSDQCKQFSLIIFTVVNGEKAVRLAIIERFFQKKTM